MGTENDEMKGNFEDFGNGLIKQGEALIALGYAVKDPLTCIGDIATLASKAGYGAEFLLIPIEDTQEAENE